MIGVDIVLNKHRVESIGVGPDHFFFFFFRIHVQTHCVVCALSLKLQSDIKKITEGQEINVFGGCGEQQKLNTLIATPIAAFH